MGGDTSVLQLTILLNVPLTQSSSKLALMTECQLNRNKMCRNSRVPKCNADVIFVFVGLQYVGGWEGSLA